MHTHNQVKLEGQCFISILQNTTQTYTHNQVKLEGKFLFKSYKTPHNHAHTHNQVKLEGQFFISI